MKFYYLVVFIFFSTQVYTQSTPAIDAVKNGDGKAAVKELKNGADINAIDEQGMSALAYAVMKDDYKLIKKLLKMNANVDASAIIASATTNSQKVIKLFSKSGFDINAKNQFGDTPIFNALKTDNQDQFTFFANAGADMSVTDAEGNTMLLYAIKNEKDFSLVEQLASSNDIINQSNAIGETPFLVALTQGRKDLVSFLLERNADINVQTKTGLSPLWFALEQNDMDLFTQFADKGADVNQVRNGETPLTYALQKSDFALVNTLFGYGADPTIDNSAGQTPLSITLKNNQTDLFDQFLTVSMSKINQPNRFGYTLLDDAFKYSSSSMIKNLIAKGAEFGPAQKRNKVTPLMYAIEFGKNDLVYELIDRATINQENFFGKTALFLAIESGNLSLMQELLRQGANINYQNYMGNTAIGYAVANNQPAMVRQLISSGAQVNTYNQYGSTPLIEAAYFNLPEIASILIGAGADRNHRANYGDNAYDLAQKLGNTAVLQVLGR